VSDAEELVWNLLNIPHVKIAGGSTMIRHLMHINFDGQRGLQEQVRESLINAIRKTVPD